MRKIQPAVETIVCDKCGEENPRHIDATGKIQFVGRDYSGAAVGGITKDFELCSTCAAALQKWFSD